MKKSNRTQVKIEVPGASIAVSSPSPLVGLIAIQLFVIVTLGVYWLVYMQAG